MSPARWKSDAGLKAVQLGAAVAVGTAAWLFSKAADLAQAGFASAFVAHAGLACLAAPLLFLAAAFLVVRFAPEARGSGIPQVLQAMESTASPGALVSIRTALIKVASACTGMLGGASIGREGPTIQIASSLFAFAARRSSRFFSGLDFGSFLVAGAAAGVAAAFNTPLAGVAFALEEIAESGFTQFKGLVMLSVIVAGITARALGGNYLYFGHPSVSDPSAYLLGFALLAGLCGGLGGGLFSRILTRPSQRLLPASWWGRSLACGVICSLLAYLSHSTSGSGYGATRDFMDSPQGTLPVLFFPEKFLATVFSYLSGMAGGIFSPCLSIGAGMGADLGGLFQGIDIKACALIGMVAFFSGVVHAPLTAVIIIMEMTDQHMLIIPFMIAAYLAHAVGRLIMPIPLYRHLAFHTLKSPSEAL